MKTLRYFLPALLIVTTPAHAVNDDQDWTAFGHVLTLIQNVVRIGTQPYPDQAMADLLAGRNHQANQAVASLFAGATAELPPEHRDRVASIGRDIVSYMAKNPVTSSVEAISTDRSLQSRKDLNAMGLRYYDEGQYLEAVKRSDQLAVELFIASRGVNLDARTWNGRSALDIARDNGNTQLAELLSRSLPAKR
ncbi:MAG TPA: hypothetical protein VF936_02260 [Burkholderiales bacterium]